MGPLPDGGTEQSSAAPASLLHMLRATLVAVGFTTSGAFRSAMPSTRRRMTLHVLPPHLEAAREEIDAGAALLCDVREPGEWASAHLASAIHVPLSGLQSGRCPPEVLDATKRLYLHCAAGIRVHPANELLRGMGCDDIVPLDEGAGELYQLGFDKLADPE